jgi:DnaJ-domain-containing protein 1
MKQELIFRGLLAIAGIWFVMRFIAPLLSHYFMEFIGGGSRKKNNVDMDILVRRQESLLRKGMEDKKSIQQQGQAQRQNRVLNTYQDILQGNKKAEHISKSDVKNILALFDELQWGDGKALKKLAQLMEKKMGASYSTSALSKKVKFIFDKEIPLVPEKVMTYQQILNATGLLAIIDVLDQQSRVRRGLILDFMANRSMLMPVDIALGYEAWAFELMGKPKEQYLKKLATLSALNEVQLDVSLEKLQLKALHTAIKESPDTIEWLKNQIQIYSELLASVKPIPDLGQKLTTQQACDLLGVSPKIATDQLKKIYKKQAKLRHPDTLKAKKIPDSFEDRARDNFVRIKQAYDVIMKDR